MILVIDQSTTATKLHVYDANNFQKIAGSAHEFPQHFPKPGWVEHDLLEIEESLRRSLLDLAQKIDLQKIQSIGITNQRETIAFWRKSDGSPVRRAIVWQDRRTSARCQELSNEKSQIFSITGLPLDPYFSSTKIQWALENDPAVVKARDAGDLRIGTIDTFILALLTNQKSFATEPSNASRTQLFNINTCTWDASLCGLFGVNPEQLPEILPTFGLFGVTQNWHKLPANIPILSLIGDQQSALLGQLCINTGSSKCTYGTGAFALSNIGHKRLENPPTGLLETIAWKPENQESTFALEGSVFVCGAAIQWLRDELKLVRNSSDIEELARSIPNSNEILFLPSLSGIGAPHWNPLFRGTILGITRGTKSSHIARAAHFGIALSIQEMFSVFPDISSLQADGGASANDLLIEIQSTLLGQNITRSSGIDATPLGAAYGTAIGRGDLTLQQLSKMKHLDTTVFKPGKWQAECLDQRTRWKRAMTLLSSYYI